MTAIENTDTTQWNSEKAEGACVVEEAPDSTFLPGGEYYAGIVSTVRS